MKSGLLFGGILFCGIRDNFVKFIFSCAFFVGAKKIALLRKCIDILNAHFLFEKNCDIIEK